MRRWSALPAVLALAFAASSGTAAALPLVAIDPGHGGRDSGATGTLPAGVATGLTERVDDTGRRRIYEKDVTLDVALRLRAVLAARGYPTILTRTTDAGAGDRPFPGTAADLARRTEIANASGAALFISIHENALGTSSTGTESYSVYVSSPESLALATAVHQEVVIRLGLPDRGIKQAGFYVLRHTVMPAVLVEGGFLTNPNEALLFARPDFRQAEAEGIATGVDRFANGILTPSGPYGQVRTPPPVQPIRYWVTAGIYRTRKQAGDARYRLSKRRIDAVVRGRYLAYAKRRLYVVVTGQYISLENAKADRARIRRAGLPGRIMAAPTVLATSWTPPPSS